MLVCLFTCVFTVRSLLVVGGMCFLCRFAAIYKDSIQTHVFLFMVSSSQACRQDTAIPQMLGRQYGVFLPPRITITPAFQAS